MSYVNRSGDNLITEPPVVNQVVEYHDRVRWGPIISGLVVAIATQLILSALGAAIGASFLSGSGAPRSNAPGVGTGVGIWSIISLLIALFVGSWVTARASGPMNRNTALLNGAILWATTLALSAWLLASGVSGAFGIAASNAGEVFNQVQRQGGVNGMFLRSVLLWHSTWLINSAAHLRGYRNFSSDDGSRNLWWAALLTYGEGWHNNHHAHPHVAKAGQRWWERLSRSYVDKVY